MSCRFIWMSLIFFIAFKVCSIVSRLYFTGLFRRFSNSNVESYEIFVGNQATWLADITLNYSSYHCHFLPSILPECLCPFHLPGITLPLEISVTFRSAKLKSFAIIAHKSNSMAGIDWTTAEIANPYPHIYSFIESWILLSLEWLASTSYRKFTHWMTLLCKHK